METGLAVPVSSPVSEALATVRGEGLFKVAQEKTQVSSPGCTLGAVGGPETAESSQWSALL